MGSETLTLKVYRQRHDAPNSAYQLSATLHSSPCAAFCPRSFLSTFYIIYS